MSIEQKKYASLESLHIFKENSDKLYATQENVAEISNTLDDKASVTHTHTISDVTNLQNTIDEINDNILQKSQVQMITSDNSNNITEILSTLKIHKLTQEKYDEALANGNLDDNAIYLTPDEELDLSGYVTVEQLDNKADTNHNHDDIYYTENEINEFLVGKVDIITGKGLSTNDLTDELKGDYDTAYTHSQAAHAPVEAQSNIIESVKVNGIALTIANKEVDIAIPTDNASLANGAGYLVASDIANKANKATTLIGYGITDAVTQTDLQIALEGTKAYADNAVAQKTQVQIITWEADD